MVQVIVHGEVVAESSGRTKKEAQQAAAQLALEFLNTAKNESAAGAADPANPLDNPLDQGE